MKEIVHNLIKTVGHTSIVKNLKNISGKLFRKVEIAAKMDGVAKWKYSVETNDKMISFTFTRIQHKNNFCQMGKFLNNKCKYMKLILPSKENYSYKDPNFAFDYLNIQKKLNGSGYHAMWPLHAVYLNESQGTNRQPEVQHTIGRKRKRVPTFTLGENEEADNIDADEEEHYKKGILLAIPQNNSDSRCEITNIVTQYNFKVEADIECTKENDQWSLADELYVTDTTTNGSDESFIHPAFIHSSGNSLFQSLEEVDAVLQKCGNDHPGIKELKQYFNKIQPLSDESPGLNRPFVVIEGLDATGKSTLVKNLVSKLDATQLQTPPKCLHSLRSTFDAYPQLLRRVYYSIGNYLVAGDIVKECATKPVVMDRFWHSTAAYTIATECNGEISCLPPVGHWIYEWPEDLLQPNIVILLTVSEEVRNQRLGGRVSSTGLKKTDEEKKMDQNILFKQRISETYKRMTKPKVIEVNADGTEEQVLQSVVTTLAEHGIEC